ncbi:MAG TPA: PilW family protein [Rhodocyclaceae bacterium]|jgi:type IV pilus assembly protein PilW|nr:PilW family protein [Rhodocyclaceae bacterium]
MMKPTLSMSSLHKPASSARGFSLVELMVALAIGMIILAALAGALIANSQSMTSNEKTSELQTNGRYALDLMKDELRSAGFRGYTWADPSVPTTPLTSPSAPADECLEGGVAAGGFISNLRQRVWGVNTTSAASNPFSANCITAANFSKNGDVLVIRGLSPIPVDPATVTLKSGRFYFRSTYGAGEVYRGGAVGVCGALVPTPAPPWDKPPCIPGTRGKDLNDFELKTVVYYLSPYTVAGENPQVPALYRVVLGGNGDMSSELVVSGVEYFQVQYGRTLTDLTTQYFNADAISGKSGDTAVTEWDDVSSVRLWILVRNKTAETGYTNTNTYKMGDAAAFTPNDSFRRELYTAVVDLRN